MIVRSHQPDWLKSPGCQAVRLGLRLANSYFGAPAVVVIYVLWLVVGLVLCLVLFPFAMRGKVDILKDALNPFALYGFVWPVALTLTILWAVKLFSRLLWCRIREPSSARWLASASVIGRLSVLVGLGYVWLSAERVPRGLLLPGTLACSAIAWLGLVADWGFVRILRHHFIPADEPALAGPGPNDAVEERMGAECATRKEKKNIFTRDFGEMGKRRFPRAHKFMDWIVLPIGYVTVSSLAADGHFQAVPEAIFRVLVITPAILEAFWIPGSDMDRIIDAFSQKPDLTGPA